MNKKGGVLLGGLTKIFSKGESSRDGGRAECGRGEPVRRLTVDESFTNKEGHHKCSVLHRRRRENREEGNGVKWAPRAEVENAKRSEVDLLPPSMLGRIERKGYQELGGS